MEKKSKQPCSGTKKQYKRVKVIEEDRFKIYEAQSYAGGFIRLWCKLPLSKISKALRQELYAPRLTS